MLHCLLVCRCPCGVIGGEREKEDTDTGYSLNVLLADAQACDLYHKRAKEMTAGNP